MSSNKNETQKIISNNPLFCSLIGVGAALLVADTLKNGLFLCVVTAIVAVWVFAFDAIMRDRVKAENLFWLKMLVGVIVSIPITMVLGIFLEPEKAVLFAAVGAGGGCVLASTSKCENMIGAIGKSLVFSLGYSLAVVIFAFVRELLAYGSIFGIKLFGGIEFFKTWYGAIFMFVITAAVYKAVVNKLMEGREEE